MIKDNKDFLPPKKLVDSKMIREVDDEGKEWHRSHPWYHFGDPYETIKGYKILDYLKFTSESDSSKDQASD